MDKQIIKNGGVVINNERNDGIVCETLEEKVVEEIPNFKNILPDDIIVFATDSLTAFGIRYVLSKGFPCGGLGHNG